MQFNNFVWSLYANSEAGKNSIEKFRTLDFEVAKKEYDLEAEFGIEEDDRLTKKNRELKFWVVEVLAKQASEWKIKKFSEAEKKYKGLLKKGLTATHPKLPNGVILFVSDEKGIRNWRRWVKDVSLGLYFAQPEFFLPYLYQRNFNLFQKICEAFEIRLPVSPKKRDHPSRSLFYLQISQALFEFRVLQNLSPHEMCAFLYDFAPNFIQNFEGKELPQASKAWIIKGGINNNGDFERVLEGGSSFTSFWQGMLILDVAISLYFISLHLTKKYILLQEQNQMDSTIPISVMMM